MVCPDTIADPTPRRRREKLSQPCKVMLFDHEVRMGESIDFQAPMKWACAAGGVPLLSVA